MLREPIYRETARELRSFGYPLSRPTTIQNKLASFKAGSVGNYNPASDPTVQSVELLAQRERSPLGSFNVLDTQVFPNACRGEQNKLHLLHIVTWQISPVFLGRALIWW